MDITIAGGGIIGLSIAWRLAQKGLRVCVRDAGELAGQASWAGAGMLSPDAEFRGGGEWLLRARDSLRQYPEFVAELESATGLGIDFRECDIEEPGETGRMVLARGAAVDPRRVCAALIEAGRELGVTYRKQDPVVKASGPLVIAAGAWSSRIAGAPERPRAFPVKGHLLGYQMAPGSLRAILRRGHHYVLQRSSGFTIVGSDETPGEWDLTPDPEAVFQLKKAGGELWEALRGREPGAVWCGLRPAVETGGGENRPRAYPLVEQAGPELWLAYGHYRNGILLAPATADRVLAMVTGGGG
jgi:glycine oxidase